MKTKLIAFLGAIFIISQAFSQNVGETAPNFTLKDLNEQNFTLSEHKGKVVFIFFMGYSCPLCLASAPEVKAKIIQTFANNKNFVAVVIDTWNGNKTAVQNFKNSTGLNATFLQQGGPVSNSWSITYDRLAVVDAEGKLIFKGNRAAGSDATQVKDVIQNALNQIATPVIDFNIPEKNVLGQNYPNPAINKTRIEFSISEPEEVSLSISDITGKVIKVPVRGFYSTGDYSVEINVNDIPGGIYFYRLKTGNFSSVKKMIVR